MSAVLGHVRRNTVAYIALFVALGGTGYAAISLPKGSVGAAQIKNHAIAPVKFDRRFVAGSVRGWALIVDRRILEGSGRPVLHDAAQPPGRIEISWRNALSTQCVPFATVGLRGFGPGSPNEAGYATAIVVGNSRRRDRVQVTTYNGQGQMTPLPVQVAVVC